MFDCPLVDESCTNHMHAKTVFKRILQKVIENARVEVQFNLSFCYEGHFGFKKFGQESSCCFRTSIQLQGPIIGKIHINNIF